MDTALPQKFPFILDRNLAKANCTKNRVCTSCDTVVLGKSIKVTLHNYVNFIKNRREYPKRSSFLPRFLISPIIFVRIFFNKGSVV